MYPIHVKVDSITSMTNIMNEHRQYMLLTDEYASYVDLLPPRNNIIAPPDHQNHMVDGILIKNVCVQVEKIKVASFLWKFHQIHRRYDFNQLKMAFIDRIKWNVLRYD